MKIKEIIVVEGKDDTVTIKRAVDADTIETNGSAVNSEILNRIRHAKEKRGVIIFTDPDYPGERIRHIVDQAVPGCKHAFLPRKEAIGHKGLGVEHASIKAIQHALENVYEVITEDIEPELNQDDLIAYGLLGGPNAKYRREQLGLKLNIGYTNGKQLLKRLGMFQISLKEFTEAMDEILMEEQE